jgi:hypothetical protein
MKILSWDVGIYNLSYCLLEKDENNIVKIIDWNIVNLIDNDAMKKNVNLIFENIPRKLNEIPILLDVDQVIIENQPSLKNPKMKSIQMILYSYFLILGKVMKNDHNIEKIEFCSASNKLKVYDGPEIILQKKVRKTKAKDKYIEESETVIEEGETKVEENKIIIEEEEIKKPKKGSALKYADKKKLAIIHAQYYLEKYNPEYIDFFNNNKKKDDLSDSYLQGLYWYKQIKK